MRQGLWVLAAVVLAGCVQPVAYPAPPQARGAVTEVTVLTQPQAVGALLGPRGAALNFLTVVGQVEPVAEAYCRAHRVAQRCDFQIVIDDRPGQSANAFQTVDRAGRPVIAFSLALIADARNADEIAFVLGHEAAHHILGHIPKQEQSALSGAMMAGILAAAAGAGQSEVEQAQKVGAGLATRRFSKDYELQADAIGAEITFHAGFDPMRGTGFFDRLPDPGDDFLGTHPGNSERKAVVAAVVAGLRGI
ncbi:MAG: Peptidase [Cypionkella sp.]|nr:Peptidase [Cypionkella sp.]